MMDYSLEYGFSDRFVAAMSPSISAFVSACKGFVPFNFMDEFSFIEVGCSRAKTITVNAMLYPKARFYGLDISRDNILYAKERAKNLDINNIEFICSRFENIADMNLPMFDAIAMVGLYTRLTPLEREAVRKFVKKKLKENGILYLEYSTIPGEIENAVFSKFMNEIIPKEIDDNKRIEKIIELFEIFINRPTKYLLAHKNILLQIKRYLDADEEIKKHILHTVLQKNDFPMYFFEVYDDFSPFGFSFLGRVELELNDPEISLFPSHVPTVAKFKDDVRARETIVDFILDVGRHQDVWCKGFVENTEQAAEFVDKHFFLIPRQSPDRLVRTVRLPGEHKFELKGEVYDFLFSQEEQPIRLSDCPNFDKDKEFVLKTFYRAAATGEFFICCDESKLVDFKDIPSKLPEKINLNKINTYLLDEAHKNLEGVYLVSMVTRGAAVQLSPLEAILLKCAVEYGRSKSVDEAYLYLHEKEKLIPAKGKLKKANEVTKDEIEEISENLFSSRKAFNLQRLGIVT